MLSEQKHKAIVKVAVKERNVSFRLASTLANFIFPDSFQYWTFNNVQIIFSNIKTRGGGLPYLNSWCL